MDEETKKLIRSLYYLSTVGLSMAFAIAIGVGIGYYLDKWLGTKGLFIIIFIVLGIAGGGVTVYRQILDITKNSSEDR